VPSLVRKLPDPKPAKTAAPTVSPVMSVAACMPGSDIAQQDAPVPPRPTPAVILPLAPDCYKVQLAIGGTTHDKLPNGDLAIIFDRALTVLLQDLERRKLAQVDRPRPVIPSQTRTRHVPAAVRREVSERDDGRCAFVGTQGRCHERGFLEFHHVIPFAAGGETTAANLQLRCRSHNAHEASEYFGPPLVRERAIGYAARSGPS
jgi:hypothetical protein